MYKKIDKVKYYLKEKISNNLFFTIFVFILLLILLTTTFSVFAFIIPYNNSIWNNIHSFVKENVFFNTDVDYLWDNIHTLVNGWWPEWGDINKMSPFMRMQKAIIAIIGILLTSTLIGFITEYISNKISEIRNSNSKVQEEKHIVILGYYFGETKLIEEIIKYADKNKVVIVIADKKEKNCILEDIKCNIDIPKNVKIIIRSIDFTDPNYLACCSLETCKTVIINIRSDIYTLRAILSCNRIIKDMHIKNLKIICNIYNSDFVIEDKTNFRNITFLNTIDFITEIIANVTMKKGIQQTFYNLLSFDGSEIYTKYCKKYNEKNFEWVFNHSKIGIPLGIIRDREFIFMPDNYFHPTKNDKLVYIAENRNEYFIDENDRTFDDGIIGINKSNSSNTHISVLIIGYNDEYKKLINCLKDINNCRIDVLLYDNDTNSNIISDNMDNANTNFNVIGTINYDDSYLESILPNYDRVIVLREPSTIDNENIDTNDESTDENSILLSLKLRKIREKLGLDFKTIISISNERNRNLIDICDDQDYIVGPNIVSMFLSQMALNFDIKILMLELLDPKGIVFDVINSTVFNFKTDKQKFSDLKYSMFKYKMVLIGIYDNEKKSAIINPKADEKFILAENISFIVIREFDNKII